MKYLIRFTVYDGRMGRVFAKNAKERDVFIKAFKKSDMISKVEYRKIYKDGRMSESKVVKG